MVSSIGLVLWFPPGREQGLETGLLGGDEHLDDHPAGGADLLGGALEVPERAGLRVDRVVVAPSCRFVSTMPIMAASTGSARIQGDRLDIRHLAHAASSGCSGSP
jgi:hypothetical protein